MSNLICHSEQTSAINLDNVSTIFHQEGKSNKVYFIFNAITEDAVLEDVWQFDTEEAANVYKQILDSFSSEII